MQDLQPSVCQVRYEVVHSTAYFYSDPVPLCHNELHLQPRDTPRQHCSKHELTIHPASHELDQCLDYFGNHVQFFTIQSRHQELSVTAKSEVRLSGATYISPEETPSWEEVRDRTRNALDGELLDARQFIFDSPSVRASTELADFAGVSFAPGRPWMAAVLDLMARIHRDFIYDPAATVVSTPLENVFENRRGVCQDFAHLQIGCLRAVGLPARYISGYLLTAGPTGQPQLVGADASHAWLASYCPELGWIEFDPTNNLVPSLEHITVAWGRDYGDVCPIKGVFVGGGQHSMRVSVDVRPTAASQ
jgi:transglutaminase-like putative cysteine protease